MTDLRIDHVESPIGTIALVATEDGKLCALDFTDRAEIMERRLEARFGEVALREAHDPGGHASRLHAYLEGELDALDTADVDAGGTPFQQRVWQALRNVPVGATRSYAEIAQEIGQPGAARAVGTANGRNPIALAIPCHRIITQSNTLGGYAGGLERKRWLLAHEGAWQAGAAR
jgi:methylated-DNA-[protein]-cysteine S-methyltransferase